MIQKICNYIFSQWLGICYNHSSSCHAVNIIHCVFVYWFKSALLFLIHRPLYVLIWYLGVLFLKWCVYNVTHWSVSKKFTGCVHKKVLWCVSIDQCDVFTMNHSAPMCTKPIHQHAILQWVSPLIYVLIYLRPMRRYYRVIWSPYFCVINE